MRREKFNVNNAFETTAIDSGTIWTTEDIPIEDRRHRRRSSSPHYRSEENNYFSTNPAGRLNAERNRGGFDTTSANFGIPRPTYDQERQRTEISDEFRFLDDRPGFATKLGRFYPTQHFSFHYRKPVFTALAIIQIFLAVCLFIFAIIRFRRAFNNPQGDLLLDFLKAEDFATTNREGTSIITTKVGSAAIIPCIMQFFAGISGLFVLYKKPPQFAIVLNMIFASFALILWFEPIILIAFELNLKNVQLQDQHRDTTYQLLIVGTILMTFLLLFINTLSIIHAASQLPKPDETRSSLFDLHINMITIVLAVVTIGFSAYATSKSMTNVALWPRIEVRNQVALYGLGLRELLISAYVFFVSIYASYIGIIKNKLLRFGSLILHIICLLVIFRHLLNGDRILAVFHNIDKTFRADLKSPFTPEIILLMYIFIILMTIAILLQLIPTTLNVFRNRTYDYYQSTYSVPRPLFNKPKIQRSAL
uniref:Uncharacterized protein n=1 Tax=Panagrolaimus sp. PS1159 TaxID=55785 RepID=A0AC35FEA2_9BILA